MTTEQKELFAIASPCIGVCQVNNKGYCKGCYRSRNERLYWHTFSDEQRGVLLQTLAARRAAVARKKTMLQQEEEQLSLPFELIPVQDDLFDTG
ncbi:DUF1289 domain-containing protein [Neisseriaceae bacterium B1]